jgi:hypothetical protein
VELWLVLAHMVVWVWGRVVSSVSHNTTIFIFLSPLRDRHGHPFLRNARHVNHRLHKHSLEFYGDENRSATSDEQVSIVHVDVGMLHANYQHAASE